MERKYYLRGLGLGIAVTAIIMGIATSGKQTMTDEEVMARAKKLGMVENTVLADTQPEEIEPEADVNMANAGNTAEEAAAEEKHDVAEETKKEETDVQQKEDTATETWKEETDVQQKEDTEEETKKAEIVPQQKQDAKEETKKTETPTDKKQNATEDITTAAVKTITVNSGDGSYTVARKLAEAGVVTSAENFDTYLCQNGYDKKLRTGTFSIPADASDEQIARIVTGAE